MNQEPQTHRVVLFGDSQVGKTSLIHRFVRESFEKQQKNTVGAVFHTYEEEVNGTKVVMQIWDTAGQENYRSLGPIYYRNASAGIAVFDVTNSETLHGLQPWIDVFRRHTVDPLLFLVGNKIDIEDEKSDAVQQEAIDFAEENNGTLYFTSAKTNRNVKELFKTVFDALVQSGRCIVIERSRIQNEKKQPEQKNVNGCC